MEEEDIMTSHISHHQWLILFNQSVPL
uniref:Uncharacterized protein n=1 Tax=Rhizophora mucronata TaxID=61149 RepID=A0A2P2K0X3_RHIMU